MADAEDVLAEDEYGSRRPPHKRSGFEDDSDRPFTPAERAHLRELLVADKRRTWVVTTIKTVSLWVIAIATALTVSQDFIRRMLHGGGP